MTTFNRSRWASLGLIGLLALGSAACAYDNYGDHHRGGRHDSRGDRDRDGHHGRGDRDRDRDHDRRGDRDRGPRRDH